MPYTVRQEAPPWHSILMHISIWRYAHTYEHLHQVGRCML